MPIRPKTTPATADGIQQAANNQASSMGHSLGGAWHRAPARRPTPVAHFPRGKKSRLGSLYSRKWTTGRRKPPGRALYPPSSLRLTPCRRLLSCSSAARSCRRSDAFLGHARGLQSPIRRSLSERRPAALAGMSRWALWRTANSTFGARLQSRDWRSPASSFDRRQGPPEDSTGRLASWPECH
jgi:hypothetical protein